MSTRAITFLKQKRVPFAVVKYDHEEKGAEFAARATGFPLDQTVKTLVVDLGTKKYCMALLPGSRQLDLKSLAKIYAVKRAVMVEAATAEKLTGYLVGGISPFGTKLQFSVVLEKSIAGYDKIHINAGQRGMMLEINPADIIRIMKPLVANIGK